MLNRYTLAQRLIGGTAIAVVLIFTLLVSLVSHEASKNALEQTQHDMRVQLDLAVSTLDYAQEALKHRASVTLKTIV